jgi:hypothetical protein
MRRAHPRVIAAGLAIAAAVTSFTASPAAASASTRASTVTGPSTAILLNGDRLIPNGSGSYGVIPAGSGFASAVTGFRTGGSTYEVPLAALPYLGRGLDPSLFDIARLPRDGRLGVTIAYRGTRAPVLPGVTVTSAAAGRAAGYLTAASARVFASALVRQFARDHATGSYGADGLFANGTAIWLAGAQPSRPRPEPRFPMRTLTVRGIGPDGKPDTGDVVFVFNIDHLSYFSSVSESMSFFDNGVAKYSVPTGHYVALSMFLSVDSHGQPTAQRMVIDPAITVAGNAAISLDARTATSRISVRVPRPAILQILQWTGHLTDTTGAGLDVTMSYAGNFPSYVSPVSRRPAAGSLRVEVNATLSSPASASAPYRYDLSFADPPGVVPVQQGYVASSANLATVTSRYYSDVAEHGYLLRTPVYAFDPVGLGSVLAQPLPTPFTQTEYQSAGTPTVFWQSLFVADTATIGGGQTDSSRSFTPGEKVTEDWNSYPLHSSLNTSLVGGADPRPTRLSATRSGDALAFDIYPFGDNTPGHYGAGFWPGDLVTPPGGITGGYELDQNGRKIASGNADRSPSGLAAFVMREKVSPATALYRLTLSADRAVAPYVLSARTRTTWTWRSARESGTVLPAGWVCPDGTRHCAPQPLMTLNYNVAGLGMNGVAPAGAQVIGISVGHQQTVTGGAVTSVHTGFSVDGGKSWLPATVKGSGATWRATFTAPAGAKVSLRVSATDADAGAITETITNAYATSGSAVPAGYRAPACARPRPWQVNCYLLYSTPSSGALAAPAGWGAGSIEKAYKLPVSRPGATVAVVEFLDTPKLETYLNDYRKRYGLPPCTTANGCFRKVNQNGQASPLPANGTHSGFDLEATLDVDMVSAVCPRCHILVVEARSGSFPDAAKAEDTAARLGAAAISNSYGARENGFTQAYASAYDHPGHVIVASSGDSGYTAASFPANLSTVTAVGGTQMSAAHNGRGYTESVWNTPRLGASGSGCSAYVAKPGWQHDPHCRMRTVADVSALAYNIAVYDTDYTTNGWLEVSGTSASSPIIAGIYALAGNAGKVAPGYEYAHPGGFFDITVGNNDWSAGAHGGSCGDDYMCVAKPGYDAPTGLGTPDGIAGL